VLEPTFAAPPPPPPGTAPPELEPIKSG
jgi:hypothetical protein